MARLPQVNGSDYSPVGAIYIPPPPEEIERLMKDLLEFSNRDDLPALIQSTIAHAQFESIHPFTDGNGRIGRALVNTILRRKGITTRVVIPIASFLVANRGAYFDDLGSYRDGQLANLLTRFTHATNIAAVEAGTMAVSLETFPEIWRKKLINIRSGSSTSKLLELLISNPVFSADELIGVIGANPANIYNAISKLRAAKILVPLADKQRNQIWGAIDVLLELEDLDKRIEARGASKA